MCRKASGFESRLPHQPISRTTASAQGASAPPRWSRRILYLAAGWLSDRPLCGDPAQGRPDPPPRRWITASDVYAKADPATRVWPIHHGGLQGIGQFQIHAVPGTAPTPAQQEHSGGGPGTFDSGTVDPGAIGPGENSNHPGAVAPHLCHLASRPRSAIPV
jgi:hypothetical protein